MGKITKEEQGFNLPTDPKWNEIAKLLREQRHKFQDKETPIQFKNTLPMGGKSVEYVKAPYMWEQFRQMCHEVYEIKYVHSGKETFGINSDNQPEEWYTITVEGKDRSTGNTNVGMGAARIRRNKKGDIVNFRHDLSAAITYALKNMASQFGIAADVYGKDIEEYSPETQATLERVYDLLAKKYNKEEANRLIEKIEDMEELELVDCLAEIVNTLDKQTQEKSKKESKIVNVNVEEITNVAFPGMEKVGEAW